MDFLILRTGYSGTVPAAEVAHLRDKQLTVEIDEMGKCEGYTNGGTIEMAG